MRDDSLEIQERIRFLVKYARRSKNPSIWWNGIEYKWDKKYGKYLHWATGPNGQYAEEPPYEAMNPLFAAAGVPEPPKEEPKKEEPQVEEKPESEEEQPPKEEEPKEEPEPEPQEKEIPEYLTDVFALSEYHEPRYESLSKALADVDQFQMDSLEQFGETFNSDEIKLLRDAKAAIDNPDILPEFRGRLIIEAYHFAREPHSFTGKKTSPDDLREFLKLTDSSRSFYDTLQTFKWTPWGTYLTPKAKHTSNTREEAVKAVFPYKTIPFLSKDQNVDIRAREKKLLELANAPTTSDAEALYILSQLGEVNSTAKSFLNSYKDFTPADGEDELFDFRKKNLFDELSAVEEKTKVLRERASNAESPKEDSKEEPKEPPKPEPETREEEQTSEPKPEPVTEPIKEETSAEPLSVDDLCEKLSSEGLSEDEAKKLIETWADSYFDPNGLAFYFDAHEASQKRYVDYFKSDSIPLEVKVNGIQEFKKTLKSLADAAVAPVYSTSFNRLFELVDEGFLSYRDLDIISNKLDKIIKKRRLPKHKKAEPVQEEETPELQEEPQEEENKVEEPTTPTPSTIVEMKDASASPDISFKTKNRLIKEWSQNYFSEDGDGYDKKLRETFVSDDVPYYVKAYILNTYLKTDKDGRRTFDFSKCYDSDGRIQFVPECLSYSWDETLGDHWIKGWNRSSAPFTVYLSGAKLRRFETREDAVKNARGLVSIPSIMTSKEKQDVLDYIDYVKAVAGAPTTTDFEACMLISDLNLIGRRCSKDTSFANEFKDGCKSWKVRDALAEIASRSPKLALKAPKWLTENEETPKPSIPTMERRTLDLSIHAAESHDDFLSRAEEARSEIMTEEEAQKDREYTAKLVEACNFVAQGGVDKAAEEISEAQEKIESLCKDASSLQSVRDYYESNVQPRLVAEEIEKINKIRTGWGLEPANSTRAKLIESEYSLTSDLMSFAKKDGIIESLASLRSNSNASVSEEELSEIERIATEIEQAKELQSQIKERRTDLKATAGANHKGYAYNHIATCAILKKAFPDRGGAPFFPPEWREETLNNIMEKNQELGEVAEQIFDVFDIIGRCFNTGANTAYPPTARFGSAGKGKWGYYSASDNCLVVDTNKIPKHDLDNIREVLAHELGHWLEDMIKGRAQKNADWLKERTGTLRLTKESQWERQEKKTPNLTVRPGGYSFRVYKDASGGILYTELISTGMEYFVRCAAMYASRSPEHFDLLIRNFEEFSV